MNHRHWLLIIIAVGYFAGYVALDRWKTTLYFGDSMGYYLHVVSFLVNQDVGDYDQSISTLLEYSPHTADPRDDKYGIRLTEKGRRYIKYTLGVPLMEVPFFYVAHAVALRSAEYEADGWSFPYIFIVGLSIPFYVGLGFALLMPILEEHFSRNMVILVTLALAFATNLFFQSVYATMSHGFLFFDYCLLIYLTVQFYKRPTIWKAFAVGAVVGLIGITRVPEVISVLIPILWGIRTWADFQNRILFFLRRYTLTLAAAIGLIAVFSIQLGYWYYVSGHLVFNPYEGEGFNFLNPQLYNGWFHFKNGWLIYTPIMAFSIMGLFFLKRYYAAPLWPILIFVFLHMYIHYSYYAWTYFPGLGSRPMVETYALLSFGLAAGFTFLRKNTFTAWVPVVAVIGFTWLNLFQTWQMKEGIIWSERGNAAFYAETFGRLTPTKASLVAYDTGERQPSTNRLLASKIIWQEPFQDTARFKTSDSTYVSAPYAHIMQGDYYELAQISNVQDLKGGEWVKVSIQSYMPPEGRIWNRDYCALFGVKFENSKQRKVKDRNIRISSQVGNESHNIWTAGKEGVWGEASFFTKVPRRFDENWTIKVFVYNLHGQQLFLDDASIVLYKRS